MQRRPAGSIRPRWRVLVRRLVTLVALGGLPASATGTPIIQEIFYDATGSDASEVFTELFGTPGLSLDGWSLVGINGGNAAPYRTVDLTGAVIPLDGLLVVASSAAAAPLAAVRDLVGNVDWQNGPDAVWLLDPLGTLVDAVQYGDAGVNNGGFGTPAPDASAGSSLSRDPFGTNTFDNLADFVVGAPTPGVGPVFQPPPPLPAPAPAPVPEPSTVVLMIAGLLSVAGRRWRRGRG